MEIIRKTVSICCQTFNHEKYLQKCLDGFLIQKTSFNYEILVHDDASTDSSVLILKEYEEKYPDLFRCVYQTENQFKKQNTLVNILLKMAQGKYIAFCEGDDYWTDPYKLQKQVDFLESNLDYGICFTKSFMLKNNQLIQNELPIKRKDGDYFLKDLYQYYNFIFTSSVVFRKIDTIPNWFQELPYGDLGLYTLIAKNKKIKYLDFESSVYRIHENGVWQGKSRENQVLMGLRFNKIMYPHVNFEIQEIIKKKSILLIEELINLKYSSRIIRGLFYRYLKYKYFTE